MRNVIRLCMVFKPVAMISGGSGIATQGMARWGIALKEVDKLPDAE